MCLSMFAKSPTKETGSSVKEKAESAKERAKAKAKRNISDATETDERKVAKGNAVRKK